MNGGTPIPLPALRDVSGTDYHADAIDAGRPSLSCSIAKILIDKSPAHAYVAHPKLNPDFARTDEDKFDLGTASHALFLQGIDGVAICPFKNWTTNAAKEARDAARAAGRIPMLSHHADEMYALVESLQTRVATYDAAPRLFADGKPERPIVWEEDGVLCRALIDWLHDDHLVVDDLKTTKVPAGEQWRRKTFWGIGCDVQAAWYIRGCKALFGVEPVFRFVVVETAPPFEMTVVQPDELTLAVGSAKVEYALKTWRECLESGDWPGYPAAVTFASPPPWQVRWLDNHEEFEEDAWAAL